MFVVVPFNIIYVYVYIYMYKYIIYFVKQQQLLTIIYKFECINPYFIPNLETYRTTEDSQVIRLKPNDDVTLS